MPKLVRNGLSCLYYIVDIYIVRFGNVTWSIVDSNMSVHEEMMKILQNPYHTRNKHFVVCGSKIALNAALSVPRSTVVARPIFFLNFRLEFMYTSLHDIIDNESESLEESSAPHFLQRIEYSMTSFITWVFCSKDPIKGKKEKMVDR